MPRYTKNCLGCDKEFETWYETKEYCSVLCREKHDPHYIFPWKRKSPPKCFICGESRAIRKTYIDGIKYYLCLTHGSLIRNGYESIESLKANYGPDIEGKGVKIPYGTPLAQVESLYITELLDHVHGDKGQLAALLEITLRTIYRKLEENKQNSTSP